MGEGGDGERSVGSVSSRHGVGMDEEARLVSSVSGYVSAEAAKSAGRSLEMGGEGERRKGWTRSMARKVSAASRRNASIEV